MVYRYLALVLVSFITFLSCGKPPLQTSPKGIALEKTKLNRLLIVGSDYRTGLLQILSLDKGVLEDRRIPIHGDAIARVFPSILSHFFVVNRLGADNIQLVDPNLERTTLQYTVGRGADPHDLCVIDRDHALLSRFGGAELHEINPLTGQVYSRFDLGRLAAPLENLPYMSRMKFIQNRVWIQVLRLKQFKPSDRSYVALWSNTLKRLEGEIPLARTNPVGDFKTDNSGKVYLAEAGFMGTDSRLDGGIEKFNAATAESEGLIIEEKALGGDLVDFEILSDTQAVALVAGEKDRLVSFHPTEKRVLGVIAEAPRFSWIQLIADPTRNHLYVAERTPTPKVRTFGLPDLKEKETLKWEIGFPPYQVTLIE